MDADRIRMALAMVDTALDALDRGVELDRRGMLGRDGMARRAADVRDAVNHLRDHLDAARLPRRVVHLAPSPARGVPVRIVE